MADKKKARAEFVTQTHPIFDEWHDVWRLCGENYEGDGGYLTGENLVGHPREYNYARQGDSYDFNTVVGIKQKLRRRRELARYDNFAQALIDIFVDHQYAKATSRTFKNPNSPNEDYLRWIEDVDGDGTHLDDWMKDRQTLAHIYGHLPVLMDRTAPDPARPRSRANQGSLVLRDYTPPDTLDWLAPRRKLSAIKFVEAVERASLREPAQFSATMRGGNGVSGETKDDINLEYFFWDANAFTVYNIDGASLRRGTHGFGELPVEILYSKRRSRIPIIGRPLLRDPKLFLDHYNMVSELRELLRSQTFSMLHIQLGPEETIETARARLGDHAGTDTVVFTQGGAAFIAPADGPAATLAGQIEAAERKMFRLLNLPWESDSLEAEAEGSRKLKAMDLNRTLAGHADEAEKFEYRIARLFYIGRYGREVGLRQWAENPPVIKYPDEFNVEEVVAACEDAKAALGMQMGKTAETLIRKRLVPIVLKDLDAETRQAIDRDIDATPYNAMQAAGEFADKLLALQEPPDNSGTP